MNWNQAQKESNEILAGGIKILCSAERQSMDEKSWSELYGNYLISHDNLAYIGEAKNLKKRLLQHSKPSTSTFFKNYLKLCKTLTQDSSLNIEHFTAQTINTKIGRKEMEEFGIVNIPANLNRFQLDKRRFHVGSINKEGWNQSQSLFKKLMSEGAALFDELSDEKWGKAAPVQKPGIYMITHPSDGVVYIGESSNVNGRYGSHNDRAYISALRRNIARDILDFELKKVNGKKKYLLDVEEIKVSNYLQKCLYRSMQVGFGRYELEEFLIGRNEPLLNRKISR